MKEPAIPMDSTQAPSKLHCSYDKLQSCNANARNWIIQAISIHKDLLLCCYRRTTKLSLSMPHLDSDAHISHGSVFSALHHVEKHRILTKEYVLIKTVAAPKCGAPQIRGIRHQSSEARSMSKNSAHHKNRSILRIRSNVCFANRSMIETSK